MVKNKKQITTLAVDIETACNLNCESKCDHALDPLRSKITCIGVYNDEISRVFRDLLQFNDFIQSFDTPVRLIGHNFKFDLKHLYFNGVDLRSFWEGDTQLMAAAYSVKVPEQYLEAYEDKRRVKNHDLPKGYSHRVARGYSLKVLAPYFLGVNPFWEDPVNHDNDEYVLKDCAYTYKLYNYFKEKLLADSTIGFYKDRLMPWSAMLLDAEIRGISIDTGLLDKIESETTKNIIHIKNKLDEMWDEAYQSNYEKQRKELQKNYSDKEKKALLKAKDKAKCKARYLNLYLKAADKLPMKMDLDSPKQLLYILHTYYGLDTQNEEGKLSTQESVIQRLYNETRREDLQLLLKYRECNKLLNTYLKPYKNLHHKGTLYCNFNPTGTRTGRLSSSKPNLQQVPSVLHPAFRARPGKKLATFDMSQIEARLIAYYSEDPVLMELIGTKTDFHGFNASIYFPHIKGTINDIKKNYPNERQFAKTLGYALFYGAGSGRVQATGRKHGYHWSKTQCQDIVSDFRDTYKGVMLYKEKIDREVVEQRGIKNLFGRKHNFNNPDDIYMKNFNTLIQGAASDLVLESGKRIQEKQGYDLLLFVHDELVVECDDKLSDNEIEQWITKCMTDYSLTVGSRIQIPLDVEGTIGQTWIK